MFDLLDTPIDRITRAEMAPREVNVLVYFQENTGIRARRPIALSSGIHPSSLYAERTWRFIT